jgi:hypothetical protein
VSNRSKAKGDRGELEVLGIFAGAGFAQIVRPRPGAEHDKGDLGGIPDLTVQVKNIDDLASAIQKGLKDLAMQRENHGTRWGVVAAKRRLKGWIAVQPLEEWAAMYAYLQELEKIAGWMHVQLTTAKAAEG